MAKRRRRRRPSTAKTGAPGKERTVYAAFVHGIGAEGPEVPRAFVEDLATWWIAAGVGAETMDIGCPESGSCELNPGHRHLRLVRGQQSARVDLDPIYWADKVERPGRMRSALLLFKVALLVGLVDLLAAAVHVSRPLKSVTEAGEIPVRTGIRVLLSSLARALGLVLRATAAPLLALIAPLAVVTKRGHRSLGDALGWGASPASRAAVRSSVEEYIRTRARGGPIVLIGHSQGGSILTDIEPDLRRRDRRDVRLVTVGSGHALLAAVDKLLPAWRLRRSAALWAAIILWLVVIVLTCGGVVLGAIPSLILVIENMLQWGSSLWLVGLDYDFGMQQAALAASDVWADVDRQLANQPASDSANIFGALAAGLVGAMVIFVALALIEDRAEQLVAAARTDARGIDVVASHDVVAASLREIGDPNRFKPVRQCCSLFADHTKYFQNACAVLPLIAEQIEIAARFSPSMPAVPQSAVAYHEAGLSVRRRTQWWLTPILVLLIAALVNTTLGGVWPFIGASLFAVGLSIATSRRNVRWLKSSSARATASAAHVRELESARRRRQNPWWSLYVAVVALPLLGGGMVMAALPMESQRFEGLDGDNNPWVLALLLGTALGSAAWFSAFGSRRADVVVLCSGLLAGLVWLQQGSASGTLGSMFAFGAGIWAMLRLRRHPSRRRPPRLEAGVVPDRQDPARVPEQRGARESVLRRCKPESRRC